MRPLFLDLPLACLFTREFCPRRAWLGGALSLQRRGSNWLPAWYRNFLVRLPVKAARPTPTAKLDRWGRTREFEFINCNAMGVVMQSSLGAVEWKPGDISGNRLAIQREMPMVGLVREPYALAAEVIARCSFSGALNECVRHDGRDDNKICADLHISAGYMSKFLRSVGEAWARRMVLFMRTTNCIAPLQKMADEMGCDVVVRASQAARIAALEAQLADARRRSVA